MKAAILSIGTEILFGQIVNTNTVYLSQQLNLLGFDVMYHHTVGDNPGRLKELLQNTLIDVDLVICTGGLGPTQDDLTKEMVCEIMKDHMVFHADIWEDIKQRFARTNRKVTENNRKQANIPSRAEILYNDCGTAPGFALESDGKCIICMPGPPREMRYMFEHKALPYLEKKQDAAIYYRMIRTFGIGESMLETRLLPLIDGQTDPTLATYAKEGESCIRVASKRKTKEEAKAAVADMCRKVDELVGDFVYSFDDEELCSVVGRKLIERNISISAAESCTGGSFAEALTSVPGISAVFDRCLVTYSNKAKEEELGISAETLQQYTAVSPQTAVEMARRIQQISGSQIGISVTGYAGPEDRPEQPAGLIYIGAVYQGQEFVRKLQTLNVSREWNRGYTVLAMMATVNNLIEDRANIDWAWSAKL